MVSLPPAKQARAHRPPAEEFTTRGWSRRSDLTSSRPEMGFRDIQERRRVIDWLNQGLRNDRPGRLVSEYPLLFSRNASAFPFTTWEKGSPIAHCMLWPVTFRVGVHRTSVGMISLVYTDPAARGRGLASEIVQAAIAQATSLELGLVLLWSDLPRLYEPLGFVRAGRESLLSIDRSVLDSALGEKTADTPAPDRARPADWVEIEYLRGNRTSQLELDEGELLLARGIPDLETRVLRTPHGLTAYAMRGRGDDFVDVIHEWGGDTQGVLHCCRSFLDTEPPSPALHLMSPAERNEVSWTLRQHGAVAAENAMGFMRIASPSAFAREIESMLASAGGLDLIPLDPDGTQKGGMPRRFHIRSGQGEGIVEEKALLDALFGSPKASSEPRRGGNTRRIECESVLRVVLGQANLSLLPIPFFVWGLESI